MAKGYDNDPIMQGILLDLQMKEGTGTVTNDWAKPHHEPVTLTGAPAWGDVDDLPILDFNSATPDYVKVLQADSADLNFISGDFSGAVWVKFDDNTNVWIFSRGLPNTDGWGLTISSSSAIDFLTSGPSLDESESGDSEVTTGVWYFIGFTRSGTSGKVYKNGVDVTTVSASHADPVTAPRDMVIGVRDTIASGFDGQMGQPRIWGRLLSASEMLELFERDRDKFGV